MALVEGTGDEAGGHALQAGEVEVAGETACEGTKGVGDHATAREWVDGADFKP